MVLSKVFSCRYKTKKRATIFYFKEKNYIIKFISIFILLTFIISYSVIIAATKISTDEKSRDMLFWIIVINFFSGVLGGAFLGYQIIGYIVAVRREK